MACGQHADNLDDGGRELLGRGLVLRTPSGAERLGGTVRPLAAFERYDVRRPDGRALTITGVPAEHGPAEILHLTGDVTGFVLSGDGVPTVYVSGDNSSVEVVRTIVCARLGTVDVALLFVGAAQTARLGHVDITLNGARAAEAALILEAEHVVPLHIDGWQHFTEGAPEVEAAFAARDIADRLISLEPGQSASVAKAGS